MLIGKRVAVVMPAYYAERTVARTVADIPREVADHIILVDDASQDRTVEIARGLGIEVHVNESNQDYGGNVKRCLQYGLDAGADVIVLLHPDAQYTPTLVPALAAMVASGRYDLCLASRTTGRGAAEGMPGWRYLANRGLTAVMQRGLGVRHSEFHTGYRAYGRQVLEAVDFHGLTSGFLFDNELLVAALRAGVRTGEISCPTSYEEDASSISWKRAVRYGLGCVRLAGEQWVWRRGR